MIYGYVRVSSITQNIDRQMSEMNSIGIKEENIYIDYQSGKNFERDNYQMLMKDIKKNDLIIIKSIDRLGRNYRMIMDEWYQINKVKGVDIKVIDMPLLDTRNRAENLVGQFISDIVLQILSFVAENERINIQTRQAEGIKLAKARGVKFGRPIYQLPDNFEQISTKHRNDEISSVKARKILNMSKSTYYKYMNIYSKSTS